MSSLYMTLLENPGIDIEVEKFGTSDLLGTLDSYISVNRSIENLDTLLYNSEMVISSLEKYTIENIPLDSQFEKFIGIEGLMAVPEQIIDAIVKVIRSVFQAIYKFLSKIIEFVKGVFEKVLRIDFRLFQDTNRLKSEFEKVYNKLSSDQQREAEGYFLKYEVRHIPKYSHITNIINTFEKVTDTIRNTVHKSILNNINTLTKKKTKKDISWITEDFKEKLKSMGISISKNQPKYKSPYHSTALLSMRLLEYKFFNKINEVDDNYIRKMWSNYTSLKVLIKQLEEYKKNLYKQEQDLMRQENIDKTVLTENIKNMQTEINISISIFAALRQVNLSTNFKRKQLYGIALRSCMYVTNKYSGKKD